MSLYVALILFIALFISLRLKSVLTFVSLLFLVLVIRSGVFIVNEGSQVVITQFGRIIGMPYTKAGFYFKIPFLWKANYFDKRIFSEEEIENNVATGDLYFISVETVANWRISNAAIFYENMGTVEDAQIVLRNIISGSVREVVSRYNLVDTVRVEDKNLKTYGMDKTGNPPLGVHATVTIGRQNINTMILTEIKDYANQYGIEIMTVLIRNITYGPSVEQNIYERMILERLTKAEELRSTGRRRYESVLGEIERVYQTIVAPAKQKADLIKGKAEAQATAIYAQAYEKNRVFYNFWRTLMLYEQGIPPNNQGTILSTQGSFLKLLTDRYALDKLDAQ
ncbi:protease modulator HflC [Legionella sp. W05-934-2]|jgi:membrane protease subunit HflC|uniref:protease modulator HflC n=1 Tax=Legionella sp. W05-934-2 TaxID=1198649 RepID=UPI003462E0A8